MSLAAISLRDLEYAIAIADAGSFVGAAEQCGVSQPSLSAQIRKIEGWLRTPIFERTTRKVLITENGRRFIQQARRVVAEARLLTSVVQADAVPFGGTLRLSAIATLGPYVFPHILRGLKEAYPNLSIILGEGLTDRLVGSLREGELDAVLMSSPVEDPALSSAELFREPFLLATPDGQAVRGSAEDAWAKLPAGNRLVLEDGHCLRVQSLAMCADIGKRDRHGTSLETLKFMVATGEGCTLVPSLAASAVEGVHYTPGSPEGFSRDIVLVWRRTDARAAQFERLAELLRDLATRKAPQLLRLGEEPISAFP